MTMATQTKSGPPTEKEKAPPGASWKDKEEHVLPKNRLGIVFFGLMCTRFLAALDQTIVATALPTIVASLGGGNSYSWVGSAYMLAAGAFGPLYGKLSDVFGRKPILYASILVFLFGSAMCGVAQSMIWLIVSRAVQGVGGGGIMQLVIIIISDIVPLKDRGRYIGFMAAMFGVAGIIGPLLGGVITEHISWRWCFFINLPTGCVSTIIVFFSLNINPHQKCSMHDRLAELDFIGLVCLVGGVVCFLIGFSFSQTGCDGEKVNNLVFQGSDTKTVALLVIGIVLLVSGGINERFTKRSAIFPARLFKTRTTVIILVSAFFHSVIVCGVIYYLPLFYQVLGASATGAGIKMLIFSLGSAIISVVSGLILSKTGKYRPIMWVAYTVLTLGMGIMIILNYQSTFAMQVLFPLIAVLGLSPLFQVPLVGLQAAMPLKDMATASSGFTFSRTIGGAMGIAVGEVIIASVLPRKLAQIPNFSSLGLGTTIVELNESVARIHLIPDVALRDSVLQAWSQAIGMIWTVFAPMAGCMLILTLFLREYTLERKTVHAGVAKTPRDLEQSERESVDDEGEPRESY